jgi:hypothetical protein
MKISTKVIKTSTVGFVLVLLLSQSFCIADDLKRVSPRLDEKKDLSEATRTLYEKQAAGNEDAEDFYSIIGNSCSWYCGGQVSAVRASSTLASQGKFTYAGGNAHDDSLATAWVEGIDGDGIGEWVEYELPVQEPRVTTIRIFNGMVKSDNLWKANGRIKVLEMSVNGKRYAVLNLEDSPAQQNFEIGVIEPPDPTKPLILRFTIMSVYQGTKYSDTALTELYFDGIGVH